MTQQLRPRRIPPSPEQQAEAFARSCRRAMHYQLHDLFLPTEGVVEETFGGKMTLPPERSESETGCSLTPPFVEWLTTHRIPNPTDGKRRRVLFTMLGRLARERPDLSLIVVEHCSMHTTFSAMAARWHVGERKVKASYEEGLDLLVEWAENERE